MLPLPLNRIDSRTGIVTEKINYRSVGRGDGGLLKRRKIKFERDPQVPLVSSIPTKFQTRLLKDNRENGAFTSRAPRFQLPAQSRMPGPASYVERQTFHGDERVDQRAVGVFASNTRRFRPTVCNYHIQGPAAYEVSRSEQNHGCPSAAFTEKSSVNPAKCRIQPSPGPGEYLWNDNQWSHHGPQASLAVVICREGAKPDLKIHDHAMRSPCPLAVTADMPQTDRSHRFDRSVAANTRRCLGSQTRLSEAKALEDHFFNVKMTLVHLGREITPLILEQYMINTPSACTAPVAFSLGIRVCQESGDWSRRDLAFTSRPHQNPSRVRDFLRP